MDLDMTLRDYWKWRLEQHFHDRYKGRSLVKMPEDLRTYQKVIEETRPNVIVELGTHEGGSALWFHDQLVGIVGEPAYVVTVDTNRCNLEHPGLIVVTGDLRSSETVSQVAANIGGGDRVMVIDDSEHSYDTTLASLNLYSEFVTPGCYFVVEDGIVDEPDLSIWPGVHGVQPAIVDFLATEAGGTFSREWKSEFGLTMHQGGWLRKGES